MIILHFEKVFTKNGNLFNASKTVKESMRFADRFSACSWIQGVNKRNAKGECEYRVWNYTFEYMEQA